jgi:SAM-dependent methyltransferase
MTQTCRICGGAASAHHVAREMMYGTREAFGYFECATCGCLQIDEIPADLVRHYPKAYYSLVAGLPKAPSWKRRLAAAWAYDRSGGLLGWAMHALKPNPEVRALGELGILKSDSILDVGCGNGSRVARLAQLGFKAAEGIDAHLDYPVEMDGRVIARRATLDKTNGKFRLVMFHHSFEHLPDQQAAMRDARRLVRDDGFVLLRIPTCDSAAWDIYGTDWVQLDAPRHLYLHSRESFTRLAKQHGFRVLRLDDDSDGFQFWGSEQYKRDIPLADPRAHSKKNPLFSKAELAAFDARAAALNAEHRGDQFCAVLVPA